MLVDTYSMSAHERMSVPAATSVDGSRALERFLREIERRALRMTEFATGNREEALDLMQDAMFGFVRHYGARAADEWQPLFWRVLNSRINDWRRRQRVRSAALEVSLRALPLRQRQAFMLRMWEGLDVAATALAMRCSQGSVKTHLSRALANLRCSLETYR